MLFLVPPEPPKRLSRQDVIQVVLLLAMLLAIYFGALAVHFWGDAKIWLRLVGFS